IPAPPDSKLPLTIKFCCANTGPAQKPSASPAVEIILMAMFFFIVAHFCLTISGVVPQSVSGNSCLGSTGHWPVAPGDSPDGTGSVPEASKARPLGRRRLTLPVGESPTGTGGSPVLPIFRTRSQHRDEANDNTALRL